ncbi:MAG: DUF433 domain-containing protein [Pseudonocardiaceae bacterium]
MLNLELLRAEIREKARRPSALAGTIERRRGALGNKQVLAGTRVPVETVRRYLDHGRSTAEILHSFPVLSEEDIEAVRNTSVA